MKIAVIGTGYVGLVTGACLAELGHHVVCLDKDQSKIDNILLRQELPIYEPGLSEIVVRMLAGGRLYFATDIDDHITDVQAVIISVGTPPNADGSADLSQVKDVVQHIAPKISQDAIIINKSTVPVGTAAKTAQWAKESLDRLHQDKSIKVVSNPEFLREGAAVEDFLNPDRIILGSNDRDALVVARAIYSSFAARNVAIIETSAQTAELIKYATNAYLATRVSFINEISDLCEKVDADIRVLGPAMGLDGRIGAQFLRPGPGYGGSCFPKDTRALLHIANEVGQSLEVVKAGICVNDRRKQALFHLLEERWGKMDGLTITLLGLTFKSDTDDVRESASIDLMGQLQNTNAHIKAFDPKGSDNFAQLFPKVQYCKTMLEAIEQSDGVVIVTEWAEFATLQPRDIITRMRQARIIDFRNLLDGKIFANSDIDYQGIGY